MRIVCPRCVAQYEVDESAIPEAGREVQCANCENIWFQDRIDMLPTSADDDQTTVEEEDRGVFDDLDGKSDVGFYSNRGDGPSTDAPDDFDDDLADDDDLLGDELDDDDFGEEDDTPATNLPIPPVNEDVLDVLRSEAAFSSARDKLDEATANALDGGELASAAEADEPADVDDLTAFLDAHAEEDVAEADPEPEIDDLQEDAPADPSFDPLADLNAIRSQLDDIGSGETDSEYTPNLPPDDPIEDMADEDEPTDTFDAEIAEVVEETPATKPDDASDEDDEPEYDDPEFDAAALTAALDIGGQDRPELDEAFDDFDQEGDGTRHAYRADGITPPEDADGDTQEDDDDAEEGLSLADQDLIDALNDNVRDPEPDPKPEPEDDTAAAAAALAAGGAAAVGLTRPRSKGGRSRARAMPGFDAAPAPVEEAADDISAVISDAADRVADIDGETLEAAVDTSRRPKRERKARLPDVEELDASLRSEAEEPRRRDREMMDAHDDEQANKGKGGFRRAFIWTLFIIALLIALYILRPQIVAALPAAAMVLDPYAALIDTLRGMINGLIG